MWKEVGIASTICSSRLLTSSMAVMTKSSPEERPSLYADAEWKPLRYTARAGLISELGRQTYDTLYKALREALLNAVDASATSIRLDFGAEDPDVLQLYDDGEGMSENDLQNSFMS